MEMYYVIMLNFKRYEIGYNIITALFKNIQIVETNTPKKQLQRNINCSYLRVIDFGVF